MDSDDEFNQFVMDEIIDSSSSDDERKAAILGAAHMIVEDTLIIRVELVPSRDMRLWIVKEYYTMVFFTKTISQKNLLSDQKLLDAG